jgi:hypothetical protein
MKRLTTYSKFTKSDYKQLFESNDDVKDIVSVVSNMLLELDFLDIEKRVDIVKGHSKLQIDQSREIIVIKLWKRAIKREDYGFSPSYNWNDVKDVIVPAMDHLQSEGFMWLKDEGTFAYNGVPIISTSGSYQFDTVKSKIEMWFIR